MTIGTPRAFENVCDCIVMTSEEVDHMERREKDRGRREGRVEGR